MYTTRVVPPWASAGQLRLLSSWVWAVTRVTPRATPRRVSGMPHWVAPASPAVMPLTISVATPRSASQSASSLPRPKMHGSPPFRRATHLPWRA
ncbi:hypothetical protein D3C78_716600 [compost metagenome]